MSIDRSLKVKGALTRHRNVLSRAERIEKLKDEEKWSEGDPVFGLQKVAHRKSHAGRKEKAAPKEAVVGAEGEAAEAAAAEETPKAEEKTEKRAVGFSKIDILPPSIRHGRSKLCIGQGSGKYNESPDQPGKQNQAG